MPRVDQGINIERYVVIPRTLIFIIRKKNKVLLIKRSEHKTLWAGQYNGIGGHIERGEDVITSARREIKEETGLDVVNLSVSAIVHIDIDEKVGVVMFVLVAQDFSGDLAPSPEGTLQWVELKEINRYPVVEDIKIILPRILNMKKGDPALSIRYEYNENDDLEISFHD